MTAPFARRFGRSRAASSALLLVGGFLLATAGAAFAFWTVNVLFAPTNHALAQADALSAPTAATATAVSSSAITVSWTAPATQLAGAQYEVTRTGGPGSPQLVCTAASTASACQDTGLTGGTAYGYEVAALLSSWQSAAAPASASTPKATQSITFTSAAPSNPTVGGTPYEVTASASSGLAVSFTIAPGSGPVCSIAGSTVSFSAAGTCTISANQGGNGSYEPAPEVQQAFAVGKGSQTITFTSTAPTSATVGTTYTVSATATSGLAVTITSSTTSTCTISGSTVSFVAVGTCTLSADQPGSADYDAATQVQQSFSVGKGSQSITFTSAAPTTATFAGATYTATATASSGLAVTITSATTSTCTISGSTVSFVGAGTCTLNADQPGSTQYEPAPQVQQTFAVAKASQTVSFTSLAPSNALVNGPTYTATATASSGLAVTITSATASTCTISGSTVSFVGVGTCTLNANQAGTTNYSPAPQIQQSFSVATLAVTSVTKTINGVNVKADFSGTGATSGSTITVTVCKVITFPCTGGNVADTITSTSISADGTWQTTKSTSNLPAGSYFVQAVQASPARTSGTFTFTV